MDKNGVIKNRSLWGLENTSNPFKYILSWTWKTMWLYRVRRRSGSTRDVSATTVLTGLWPKLESSNKETTFNRGPWRLAVATAWACAMACACVALCCFQSDVKSLKEKVGHWQLAFALLDEMVEQKLQPPGFLRFCRLLVSPDPRFIAWVNHSMLNCREERRRLRNSMNDPLLLDLRAHLGLMPSHLMQPRLRACVRWS